jgi:ubiquinone/menaquinone biosynthesis C-methylase UbiE
VSRPQQLRQEYESTERAAHYRDDRWTRSARARRTNAKELAIVQRFLQQCGTLTTAIDVPCGTGRFRQLLQTHVAEVLSIDASFEMLAAAASAPQVQASAHKLPLVNRAADFILCSRLLHHFADSAGRLAVLQELARVSTRWVVLSYFDTASFQAWRNRRRGKFRGRFPISKRQFLAEIHTAGLVERQRCYIQRGFSEQVWVLLEVQG